MLSGTSNGGTKVDAGHGALALCRTALRPQCTAMYRALWEHRVTQPVTGLHRHGGIPPPHTRPAGCWQRSFRTFARLSAFVNWKFWNYSLLTDLPWLLFFRRKSINSNKCVNSQSIDSNLTNSVPCVFCISWLFSLAPNTGLYTMGCFTSWREYWTYTGT